MRNQPKPRLGGNASTWLDQSLETARDSTSETKQIILNHLAPTSGTELPPPPDAFH